MAAKEDEQDAALIGKITKVLVDVTGRPADDFKPEARLEDLEVDSLERVEIAIALEEELDIVIPDAREGDVMTVADLFQLVKECRA